MKTEHMAGALLLLVLGFLGLEYYRYGKAQQRIDTTTGGTGVPVYVKTFCSFFDFILGRCNLLQSDSVYSTLTAAEISETGLKVVNL